VQGFPITESTESNKKNQRGHCLKSRYPATPFQIMPGDETQEHHPIEFDSEPEEEEEQIPLVDVDVTKLTALSPEVISKQVRSLQVVGGFEMATD
jgi:hypothetical protein